jgi:ribosomal protein S18 acetylase RimI-like enzyme
MNAEEFRPARRDDCGAIAALYSIASDGIADYIWSKQAEPGEDLLQVGRRRYEREDTAFSYQNCRVAEIGGRVAGMLVAFPMHVDLNAEPEPDPVLRPYAVLEEDASYYICGVALFPEYRGQGMGSRFMEIAEADAGRKGLLKTSLLVFEENCGAKRLYDRLGYRVVARKTVVPHPLVRVNGEVFLMVKDLR